MTHTTKTLTSATIAATFFAAFSFTPFIASANDHSATQTTVEKTQEVEPRKGENDPFMSFRSRAG